MGVKALKIIGYIALIHIVVMIAWLAFNIIFSLLNPFFIQDTQMSMSEMGLDYHSAHVGYLAMDHGSKALLMLMTIAVPIGTRYLLKRENGHNLINDMGLVFGTTGFLIYALSLMLQAASVAYAIELFKEPSNDFSRQFAIHIYEWTMLEGGFSTSFYVLANTLIGVWMIVHSKLLYPNTPKIAVSGFIIGIAHIIAYVIAWFFLMFGDQTFHTFTEGVGLLLLVWLFMIGLLLIKTRKNDLY